MSKLCAIIIDLDLMTEEEWKSLWDRKCTQFGRPAALYIRKELDHCDRCGKKLRPLEGDGTKMNPQLTRGQEEERKKAIELFTSFMNGVAQQTTFFNKDFDKVINWFIESLEEGTV